MSILPHAIRAANPITRADLKRACYFKLRLPDAPMAIEPPDPDPDRAGDGGGEWEPWHDEVCIELGPEAEPIGTADAPGLDAELPGPTAEDSAWWLGFRLGAEGEHPAPPAGTDRAVARSFFMGRLAGFMASPESLAWQDDMRRWRDSAGREAAIVAIFEGPEDRASDGERMEAMGAAAFPRRNDWD